jgi:hypothetical protein
MQLDRARPLLDSRSPESWTDDRKPSMAGKGKTTPLGNWEGATWPSMIARSERSATNFHICVIVGDKRGGIRNCWLCNSRYR